MREPIEPRVWRWAAEMSWIWSPAPTIVMDLCLTVEGQYKVLEWNCLNSSGFYACDVGAIVTALEERYS
jgi:hypothetical protein